MQSRIIVLMAVISIALAGCASPDTSKGRFKVGAPYKISGQTYYPEENYTKEQTGVASWYGPGFDGKKTANGERFDEDALTAAHPTLQMPSMVRVTNLENGKSIIVRVNDRGPFHSNRVIDVSKGAAEILGMIGTGTSRVRLQVLGPESKALANAAKKGVDTRGAEIAMNNTGRLDERFAPFYPNLATNPAPVIQVAGQGYQPGLAPDQVLAAQALGIPRDTDAINETIIMNDSMNAPLSPGSLPPEALAAMQAPVAGPATEVNEKPKMAFGLPMPTFQMAPIPETAVSKTPVSTAGRAEMPAYKPAQKLPGIPVATLQQGDIVPVAPGPNRLPSTPDFRGLTPARPLVKPITQASSQ